jgi:hypothetical protein
MANNKIAIDRLGGYFSGGILLASVAFLDKLGEPNMKRRASQIFLYSAIVVAGVLVSLATGLLSQTHVVYPPPEVWNYGLPFSWKAVIYIAGPTGPMPVTDWNWFAFAIDALFYMAAGCLAVFPYQRKHRTMKIDSPGIILSTTYIGLVLLFSIMDYLTYCGMRQCI